MYNFLNIQFTLIHFQQSTIDLMYAPISKDIKREKEVKWTTKSSLKDMN